MLQLSHREMQIAALICEGKQNKNIAYLLGISEFTVENHLRRIYRKLNIHSRSALVSYFSRRAVPIDAQAGETVYLRTAQPVTH